MSRTGLLFQKGCDLPFVLVGQLLIGGVLLGYTSGAAYKWFGFLLSKGLFPFSFALGSCL